MSSPSLRCAILVDTGPLVAMAGWMRQYSTLPMDLADASLLWVAHEYGIRRIATLDRRDFGVYRLPGGEGLENQLEH